MTLCRRGIECEKNGDISKAEKLCREAVKHWTVGWGKDHESTQTARECVARVRRKAKEAAR